MRISDWSSDVCSSDLLIEPAIEHVPANVLVTSKPLQLCAAYVVIADQYKDQRQLGVKPAACTEQTGIQNDHPYAKHQRGDHGRKHDAAVKLTLHDLEALSTGFILTHRVINEIGRANV